MNRYGRQAMRHWRENLPEEYAQIEDPETFFTNLGGQMHQQVIAEARTLAGDDPGGETYLEKLGRLNMAEVNAAEKVIRETLPVPEQAPTS